MSKLPDVRGRITYISSYAKQENLYAVYETAYRHYWTELAKCNQQEFQKSGTEGKCIEEREFIIALPESFFVLYEPDKLLQLFTDRFKEKYGVECVSALHHNKRKTNYHIHLIFSERELLPEPIEKTATRNMFYDENGKHVRTKKEILDENRNVRKGCKIVKKGEVYEHSLFTTKNKLFKQENFVDEVKHFYTDLINLLVKDDKEKLHVFDSNGLYLATKKIGKNNPKAEQIQTDEERTPEKIPQTDKTPKQEHNLLKELTANLLAQKQELQPQTQVIEQVTPQIPPKPVMSAEAAAYPKLLKIYKELNRQNGIIFDAERERNELELERDSLKGLAKLTKKGELQSRIDRKNEEIDLLKVGLSGIIKRYGYQNVQEFYRIYRKSYNAYIVCKEQVTKWEKTYGDDNQKKDKESVLERLRNPPKKTADYQQQGILKGKDRGAR